MIRLQTFILIILTLFFTASISLAVKTDSEETLDGCWKKISRKSGKIQAEICFSKNPGSGTINGTIKKLYPESQSARLCTSCPGKLKNMPIEGMTIITNLKKDADHWNGGAWIDTETGDRYKCKIWKMGNRLKVQGYLAFFYLTEVWVK